MGDLFFRDATEADARMFASWEKAERPYPWAPAHFSVQNPARRKVIVLVEGGAPAAFAAVHWAGSEAYLENIMVDPARRRRGFGGRVLEKVVKWIAGEGAGRLCLEVDPRNGPALALYRKAGFLDLGTRPSAYPNGEAARVMEIRFIQGATQ